MLGFDVEEVNVQPVDLGNGLRVRREPGLNVAPVVVVLPVPGELLHRRQLHTLGIIADGLAVGPAGCRDAPAKVNEIFLGYLCRKRSNSAASGCYGGVGWQKVGRVCCC